VDLPPETTTVEASAPSHTPAVQSLDLGRESTADFTLRAVVTDEISASGRLVDVLSARGLPGLLVAGAGLTVAPSDSAGSFRAAGTGQAGSRSVTVSGSGVVERRTHLPLPGQNLTISMIPDSFDLRAFDEMLRDPGLRRWTSAPPLVIEHRTVQFTDIDMTDGQGVEDVMTDAEADGLAADLVWALPQLTGGTFGAFEQVSRRTTPRGGRVVLLNPGVITVARVAGLSASQGTWGWSRWLYDSDGTVRGGIIMLDRDFERSASAYRRSLRAHELGHALGYAHVTARPSVMNASGRVEPTDFDRDATRIAFQRQTGSRAPDIDPDQDRSIQRTGPARWSQPLP
jgi:hypothetical protein